MAKEKSLDEFKGLDELDGTDGILKDVSDIDEVKDDSLSSNDNEVGLSNEEIDEEVKKRMKIIDAKLKEIRELRIEIRELNKKRVKKGAITVHVPSDKKEEIKKRIEEIMNEYRELD